MEIGVHCGGAYVAPRERNSRTGRESAIFGTTVPADHKVHPERIVSAARNLGELAVRKLVHHWSVAQVIRRDVIRQCVAILSVHTKLSPSFVNLP